MRRIWLLLCALGPPAAAAPACGPPPPDAAAQAQYLATTAELRLWRAWTLRGSRCVQVDWPQPRMLQGAAAAAFERELDDEVPRRADLVGPALARATPERAGAAFAPAWQPTELIAAPEDRPSLPLCPRLPPRERMAPLQLPPALAPTVLRVRPHRCAAGGLPLAGSGVLLAPTLGMTAAHVVLTPAGRVCSRYRLAPGGRRFSDAPHAPHGTSFVSRAELSGRGGWSADAAASPPMRGNLAERTRHDHAWLLLDDPARLPADTAWPRLRFGAAPAPTGTPVLTAGYPAQTPSARSAPGAMVALWGQVGCMQAQDDGARRHALWLSRGGSGGPIWTWTRERPLELHSLAVRVEGLPGERHETLGPALDRIDYSRLLEVLARDRDWRIARAERARDVAATQTGLLAAEAGASGRGRCAIDEDPDSLMGHSGLSACRARCASRPRSCRDALD